MNYANIFSSAQAYAQSLAQALPEQHNCIIELLGSGNSFAPSGITGNYRPTTNSLTTLTARVYPATPPQTLFSPGTDVALLYFEGVLVAPKSYLFKKELKARAVINGDRGQIQIIPLKTGAISQFSQVRALLGQKIAITFLAD